jgi:RNA polymerase sigma-70 factor, ECF subfamily
LAGPIAGPSVNADAGAAMLLAEEKAELLAIPATLCVEFARQADLARTGLSQDDFIGILRGLGGKHNFNLPSSVEATAGQREAFWRSLHLRDLALAQACARGCEMAWNEFLREFQAPMQQAAIAITRSSSAGKDLADSLYAELFGMTEREGARWSPLASYSGRGALMGWLRTTLAQRHVNHHRSTFRENPLESDDFPAASGDAIPEPQTLVQLASAVQSTLGLLSAEDRFMLTAYFLDGHTLAQLAALLRVHEATVSRRIKRLTESVRKKLLKHLEARGMSRDAAREALGADPRDLSVNLRNLLQSLPGSAFSSKAAQSGEEKT